MQIVIAIDSFAYAEICVSEHARTGHTQSRKILRHFPHYALCTTTVVYDIRHARLMSSAWRFNRAMYADVYAFMPANVIHLCKLYRLRRLQDKYSRGFDAISLVFPTIYRGYLILYAV